jgi:hypothetical protein
MKSKRMKLAEHSARMGAKIASRILTGKPEGKRPLGRPRHRLLGNIKMTFRLDGVVWTGLIWLRIGTPMQGSCVHGNEPSGYIKCWEVLE